MNEINIKDSSALFVIKIFLYIALMLVAFVFIAMGVVPFLVRLDTMDTSSRIGHGLVALASIFFIRFAWRRYANLFKEAKAEQDKSEKGLHEAAINKQKRYQSLTHNDKLRELEKDKKAKTLEGEKTLKNIRYKLIGLSIFYAIGAIYAIRSIPQQGFLIAVIGFGSIYLFFIVFALWLYKHKKIIVLGE